MKRALFLFVLASAANAQRFYPDDPLEKEPVPRNVDKVLSRKLSDYYDLFSHQFGKLGERQPKSGPPIRAKGVNTLGEPMEGAWWVKRHYYRRMSPDELKRGPAVSGPPVGAKWTVIGAKSEGITPGFTVLDEKKRRFFVKFDPRSNPEMATAADSISSRLFHALGYHVPENYIVHFDPEKLVLGDDVQLADSTGKKRKMTDRDIYEILVKVPRAKDGSIRATASLGINGKPIGPPRFYGTRKDDPNDTVPHEHRRDQRGLHVVCAWLAHDDSRSINNFDALVKDGGAQFVRHYLLDFGSTLGSGSDRPNSPRSGAYFFSWKKSAVQLFSLGLAVPYWARAHYEYFPSIGLFEGDAFDPEAWVPEYPNPAFLNRLPDDEFWAAKQVMALTDDDLRAVVSTGELTDTAAAEYLLKCLIKRRDKIGKVYYAKVLPFDRFRVQNGELRWDDLSKSVTGATVKWESFDNRSGARAAISKPVPNGFSVATISAASRPKQRIEVFVRAEGAGWKVVGVERNW